MVEASDASNHIEMFRSLGKGGTKENVILVSPSGSVALNSPITVPTTEFSAMVRLLAEISVGAELALRREWLKSNTTERAKKLGTKELAEGVGFQFSGKILEKKTFKMWNCAIF